MVTGYVKSLCCKAGGFFKDVVREIPKSTHEVEAVIEQAPPEVTKKPAAKKRRT